MKVIFLDFDGVLNSAKSFAHETKLNKLDPNRKVSVSKTLSQDNAAIFQTILDQVPEVKIVISSTWRRIFTLDELKAKLKHYGIDSSRVIGITPGNGSDERGIEIQQWLNDHPEVKSYAILDDDRIIGHAQRFIQTSWNDGLLKKHAKKVLEIFGIH